MHEEPDTNNEPLNWRAVAAGFATLVLVGGGYLIGDLLSGIRQDIRELRATADARATLATRVESCEKSATDHEDRIRQLERWVWRNNSP